MKNSESFFTRLESLRGTRTKAEFSKMIGVSPPLYQKWSSGSIPGGDKLNSISQATGKSVAWLLTGDIHAHGATVNNGIIGHNGTVTTHQQSERDSLEEIRDRLSAIETDLTLIKKLLAQQP